MHTFSLQLYDLLLILRCLYESAAFFLSVEPLAGLSTTHAADPYVWCLSLRYQILLQEAYRSLLWVFQRSFLRQGSAFLFCGSVGWWRRLLLLVWHPEHPTNRGTQALVALPSACSPAATLSNLSSSVRHNCDRSCDFDRMGISTVRCCTSNRVAQSSL